jgi:lipoic acid synthetase
MQTLRPPWLDKKIRLGDCAAVKETLRGMGLRTVCEDALCPNIGECFAKARATFLILGKNCTRLCSFCAVSRGEPAPVDPDEPRRVAECAARLGLRHVVVTGVTRDDLPDGGARAFVDTLAALRVLASLAGPPAVELLIPDFRLDRAAIRAVVEAGPDILAHNVETVPRLYPRLREGADYGRSLEVLRFIKECDPGMTVKSGIMVGLGESEAEVLSTMADIAATGCGMLSIGQYLAPSRRHFPAAEYVAPERFDYYREKALEAGFNKVMSAPYVRSSYMA